VERKRERNRTAVNNLDINSSPASAHDRSNTPSRPYPYAPTSLPLQRFQVLFTLLSECFSSFARATCSLSVSSPYLALDGIYRPTLGCIPKQPDSTPNDPMRSRTPSLHRTITFFGRPFQTTLDSIRTPSLGQRLQFNFPPQVVCRRFGGEQAVFPESSQRELKPEQ